MNKRTRVLLGILIVVGAVVVGDRYLVKGVRESGGDATDGAGEASARERYDQTAALAAEKRGLLEAEPAYAKALAQTRAHWREIRDRLVTAPSASLAEAQFRDEVLEFARRREIDEPRTSRIESSALDGNERIRLIELDLEFETPGVAGAYALIDGLENMRGMLTHVAAVDLSGPGRIPRELKVSARITVQAIAQVEGDG